MSQLPHNDLFQTALQHLQSGRLVEAESLYRQILTANPNHPDALHHLGLIAAQLGYHDSAMELIGQALAHRSNDPDILSSLGNVLNNLGNALQARGQLDEAIAAFRQALTAKPNFHEACYNLGNALKARGMLDPAITAYRQALALQPRDAEVCNDLASALKANGQLDEAIAVYRQALALKPDFHEAYYNLGNAFQARGLLDEAIAAFRHALALKPDFQQAFYNLGNALKARGRLDEAIIAFHEGLALSPDNPDALSNLGSALKDMGQLDDALATFRHALTITPDNALIHSNLIYTLHFHPACEPQQLADEHRRWNRQHAAPLKKLIQPHDNDRNPNRRLHIGYVSPDFRDHVIGRFLLPLFVARDHDNFSLFCYSDVSAPDSMTDRLRAHTDHWRSIVGLSDEQTATLIRQDRIDILVDLTMHMARNRLLVFARKPAPIQVTYLAYCSTTGLDTIDYRLTDPYLDPPPLQASDTTDYSEESIRLPQTYWCYAPPPGIDIPPVNALPARETNRITFACLNNFCKVSEPALTTWARILQALPNSRLILHAHPGMHRDRVTRLLANLGSPPSPPRCEFIGHLPTAEYFKLYQQIDLALDPFPYSGGTTTCDALWMGVPTITLAGPTAVGRGGVSILSNLNLPELIAHTPDEYVHIATTLAQDLPRLANLRATLRQRMQKSPLMDAPKFTRAVESAYRQMWRDYCLAQPNTEPRMEIRGTSNHPAPPPPSTTTHD